jgi:hypothetical protein
LRNLGIGFFGLIVVAVAIGTVPSCSPDIGFP